MQRIALLDFYRDITDKLEIPGMNVGDLLMDLLVAHHEYVRNDTVYMLYRHYSEDIVLHGGAYYLGQEVRPEWEKLLADIWELYDLGDDEIVIVWVSW